MKSVFVLHHSYDQAKTGEEEAKLIGVYSTREKTQEAIDRLSNQPGFEDFPDYFSIDEYEIDEDNWTEGFVTETHEPKYSVCVAR